MSFYANHVGFSGGDIDIAMMLSESRPNEAPEQRARVTMTWQQAKIMSFFLQVNLIVYEDSEGPIHIPEQQIPSVPPPPGEGASALRMATYRKLKALHDQFVAAIQKNAEAKE